MFTPGIVKPLDVIEQVGARLIPGGVATPVHPLQLQRREEALHRRIVPAIAPAAHAAGDVLLGQQPLKLLAAVLAALVRVVHQRLGLAAAPDGHHQRIEHELGGHLRAHRPADGAAAEEIQDDRQIQPAFAGADVGEVGDPLLVGAGGLKLPVEHVRGNAMFRTHPAVGRRAQPSGTGTQPRAAHQPRHPLAAATLTPFNEVVPDPGRTVGGIALREACAYQRQQSLVLAGTPARLTVEPLVETAA